MRRVPVYFDHDIDLAEILQLIADAGYVLQGNRRAELIVTRADPATPAPEPSNVISFERCALLRRQAE